MKCFREVEENEGPEKPLVCKGADLFERTGEQFCKRWQRNPFSGCEKTVAVGINHVLKQWYKKANANISHSTYGELK